jgi:hypothetical protein
MPCVAIPIEWFGLTANVTASAGFRLICVRNWTRNYSTLVFLPKCPHLLFFSCMLFLLLSFEVLSIALHTRGFALIFFLSPPFLFLFLSLGFLNLLF